jgi:hypothetical protein
MSAEEVMSPGHERMIDETLAFCPENEEDAGMKLVIASVIGLLLLWSGVAVGETWTTPVLDGVIGADWDVDSGFELVVTPMCSVQVCLTWDYDFLWFGINSDSCRRYLGDGPEDVSFFVAIDVDQTFGSGAPGDGYGNAQFAGCYMPEYIFYYAGGAGWYEWSEWDPAMATWLWHGWRNDNTFYAWDGGGVYDDEIGILWSDIGNPTGVAVIVWNTFDDCFNSCPDDPAICGSVLFAWPTVNPIDPCPTLTWAYPFFDPFVPWGVGEMGFAPNSVPWGDNGEASPTGPGSWGGIKALYR